MILISSCILKPGLRGCLTRHACLLTMLFPAALAGAICAFMVFASSRARSNSSLTQCCKRHAASNGEFRGPTCVHLVATSTDMKGVYLSLHMALYSGHHLIGVYWPTHVVCCPCLQCCDGRGPGGLGAHDDDCHSWVLVLELLDHLKQKEYQRQVTNCQ